MELVVCHVNGQVITAESEEEAVWKFGVWKREMETRGLKVNINKTKLMVMGREPAVRPQRGRYPSGVCDKGVRANSIWCQCCERWCHQRCSGGELWQCQGHWRRLRESVSLLVDHSILLEERVKVSCACVRPVQYAAETQVVVIIEC